MVLGLGGGAAAQQAEGFALNRFDPSERGSEWFVLESLDLRGNARIAAGVVGDWSHKPLVLYAPDGSEDKLLVRDQLFVNAGAGLILRHRLRLAFNVPIAVWQRGEEGTLDGVSYAPPAKASLGDVRVGADVRLLGTAGDAFTLAVGAQVHIPTGSRSDYTGDGKVRAVPRVLAAGDVGPLAYAGRLGFALRARDGQYATGTLGSEVQFAAAVGLRLADRKLVVGPEIYGGTVVSSSDAVFKKLSTPLELIVGGHYTIADQVRAGLGVGPGLTRAFGTPQVRVLASLEYAPAYVPPPPPDRDQDGIVDAEDACPDVAGVKTSDPKTNGCPPPPPDRDQDGIVDAEDACPDVAGVKTSDPKTNGCPPPPPDRDQDGIVDAEDACPDVAGVKTEDPKTNGCPPPPPDRDGDGILDSEDACPDAAGPKHEDPKQNGCPAARIEAGEIKILQQVKFKTNSATILPESDAILTAVADILKGHPEIKKVLVEGHTDNRGGDRYNLRLSDKRAQAVLTWLVTQGVDNARLSSRGFGATRPIEPNATEEGRRNNRRVEFHIEPVTPPPAAGEAKPAAGEAKPAAGEAKPAAGEAKPAGDEVKSATPGPKE
jgi:outer membrane protein OmpA-like peptidoglycan-associated protein